MRKLSKSIDEYLSAGGWSSSKFFEHAKSLFNDRDIKQMGTFEVGRSVIYYRTRGTMIKFYVHHAGRSKEFMTMTDENSNEIATFHYTVKTQTIKDKIMEYGRENT